MVLSHSAEVLPLCRCRPPPAGPEESSVELFGPDFDGKSCIKVDCSAGGYVPDRLAIGLQEEGITVGCSDERPEGIGVQMGPSRFMGRLMASGIHNVRESRMYNGHVPGTAADNAAGSVPSQDQRTGLSTPVSSWTVRAVPTLPPVTDWPAEIRIHRKSAGKTEASPEEGLR